MRCCRKKFTFAISSLDEFLLVFSYDLRKYYFSARIVNIWNSLPNHVVDVNSVNVFNARLDRFWMDQDVKYDFTADLTGTGEW